MFFILCSKLRNKYLNIYSFLFVLILAQTSTVALAQFPNGDWPVSNPREQGMNEDLVRQSIHEIKTRLPKMTSFLVIKNGSIVAEEYFNGTNPEEVTESFSFTKIVTGTLMGILLEKKKLPDIDTSILPYLKGGLSSFQNSEDLKGLNFFHLLSMTSGFDWDPTQFHLLYERLSKLENILGLPLAHKPGEYFNYDDANAHLLSYMIETLTGMKTSEFARANLFTPLGIKDFNWWGDTSGTTFGGFGLQLKTRDLARIGYLYLKEGQWGDAQVLPKSYVTRATTAQNAGGWPGNSAYGLFWWIMEQHGHRGYYGLGLGGQLLAVVPDLDLIVVLRADLKAASDYMGQAKFIISDYIMPAVLGTMTPNL